MRPIEMTQQNRGTALGLDPSVAQADTLLRSELVELDPRVKPEGSSEHGNVAGWTELARKRASPPGFYIPGLRKGGGTWIGAGTSSQ